MPNPNRTVKKFNRKITGFSERPPDEFTNWFFIQVQNLGRTFESIEQAKKEFNDLTTNERG